MKFNIDFYGKRKLFVIIALIICGIGFACNFVPFFGPTLDIQFKGGAITSYSYEGTLDRDELDKTISDTYGDSVEIQFKEDKANNVTSFDVEYGGKEVLPDIQTAIREKIQETYKENDIKLLQHISVSAQMGREFLIKCIIAVVLASILLLIYVGFRFRKIGGISAGSMSLLAIVHDVFIAYVVFVVCNFTINDNFIAVVLTILGFGLNDTVVIYDRVRENRRIMGPKASIESLVNNSVNQCMTRTIFISLVTIMAVGVICVVALVANISSILSFAFPMFVTLIASCYSTNCIALPLWGSLQKRKENKLIAAKSK